LYHPSVSFFKLYSWAKNICHVLWLNLLFGDGRCFKM
jgi:hypothetical protein